MNRWSKGIDKLIADERKLKAELPEHPRFTNIRREIDAQIVELRRQKKEALLYWRELKRNPKITP